MFRISRSGDPAFVDADTVEQLEPAVQSLPPGRYIVFEISDDPDPTAHAAIPWGIAIKRPAGSMELEPDPPD